MGETSLHVSGGTCRRHVNPEWTATRRPMTDAPSLIGTRTPLHAEFQPQEDLKGQSRATILVSNLDEVSAVYFSIIFPDLKIVDNLVANGHKRALIG